MDPTHLVNFPPDPNPKIPRLKAPPGSWDTHFHVWAPHLFPYAAKRRYTPPAAPVEHYLKMARAIGLARGCIVQPSVHVDRTEIVLDAVQKSEGALRGMIIARPNLTSEEIAFLHAGGVRGVRFASRSGHGNRFDRALFTRIAELVAPFGWILDLQIDDDSIVELADLIAAQTLPTIIDTMGHIDARKGLDQPALRTLLDLVAGPGTFLKLHGANRFLAWGVPYADIVAVARTLVTRAPHHMLWGTDWPHSEVFEPRQMPNDADLLDMLLDYAPDEAVRKLILVDNPKGLYDFD